VAAQYDSPDWTKIVTTVASTGAVTDAPDWQRIVVGPGGTPVGGGSFKVTAYDSGTLGPYSRTTGGAGTGNFYSVGLSAGVYLIVASILAQDTSGLQNWLSFYASPTGPFPPIFSSSPTSLPANGYATLYATTVATVASSATLYFDYACSGNFDVLIDPPDGNSNIKSSYSIATLAVS
jgi:hypothetical protein